VRRYIANQGQHHHRMKSEEEFALLLKHHGFDSPR
jgi:hypothetical protein